MRAKSERKREEKEEDNQEETEQKHLGDLIKKKLYKSLYAISNSSFWAVPQLLLLTLHGTKWC